MKRNETAQKYAAWGWPVFPCNGKIPLIKGWPDAASIEDDQLTGWWQEWPEANIGLVTGPRSGLLVIDIDGPTGKLSLERLIDANGEIPETLTATTGNGFHLYLSYPAGADIRNDISRKLGEGLDVRGAGGYVIAPGSQHANGTAYRWVDPDMPVADPPDWLIELLTREPDERPPAAPTTPLKSSRGTRYAEAALTSACATVEGSVPGTRNDNLNRQSFSIGQLVGAGALPLAEAENRLMDAAISSGLSPREAKATVQSGLHAGLREPRDLSTVGSLAIKSIKPAEKSPLTIQTITAADLMALEFPTPRWAIPGLLPEGLTILAGRPKTGKSWLAFDVCLAISRGGQALGNRPVPQGSALYLALEDHHRRLQDRLLQLVADEEAPNSLFFSCQMPRFEAGGLAALEEWLDRHPACRLVVLDTLARFRPTLKRSEDPYMADTLVLSSLQRLAVDRSLSVVVVHHTRKTSSETGDPLDEVLGSTGITGTADAIWVLQRPRNESTAFLTLTGRDIGEEKHVIEFDPDGCRWHLQMEAPSSGMSEERRKILAYLEEIQEPTGPKAISEATGLPYDSVRHLIRHMEAEGAVKRKARGQYVTETPSQDHNPAQPHAP